MITIPLSGITRNPSDTVSPDGHCADLVNLIVKDGIISPYIEPAQYKPYGTNVSLTYENDRVVYIHKTKEAAYWIVCGGANGAQDLRLFAVDNGESFVVKNTVIKANITDLVKVDALKNILIIHRKEGLRYALLKAGEYAYLGAKPEQPIMQFALNGEVIMTGDLWCDIITPMKNRYDPFNAEDSNNITNAIMGSIFKDIAKAKEAGKFIYPLFVRYALRMYDDSLICHSAPIYVKTSKTIWEKNKHVCAQVSSINTNSDGNYTDFNYAVYTVQSAFSAELINYNNTAWCDIVKSIDVFISEPIYEFDQNGKIDKLYPVGTQSYANLPFYDSGKSEKLIANTSNFYLLKSFPLTKGINSFPLTEIPCKDQDALVSKERISDDLFISHENIPESIYLYNNKLHAGSIRRRLFKGYHPTMFSIADNAVNNVTNPKAQKVEITTFITTESFSTQVHSGATNVYFSLIPYVYYPDPRATRMIISVVDYFGSKYEADIQLKPHPLLNGAYAFGAEMKPVSVLFDHTTPTQDELKEEQLKVSELNNPFQLKQTYSFQGEIIGIAAPTAPLSQGQVGDFDLYVFTSSGIWASKVGAEVYTAHAFVSGDVCTSSNSIIQTDTAVVFASARGLMGLLGNECKFLSEALDGEPCNPALFPDLIDMHKRLTGKDVLSSMRFGKFMNLSDTSISFDSYNNRLMIINEHLDEGWLFDLSSFNWSRITTNMEYTVSCYPECYAVGAGHVHKLSDTRYPEESPEASKILLLTRPIKFSAGYRNRVFRAVAESKIIPKGSNVNFIMYGSADCVTWGPISGISAKENSHDQFTLHGAGSPLKYYAFAIVGCVDARTQISAINAEVETPNTNKIH